MINVKERVRGRIEGYIEISLFVACIIVSRVPRHPSQIQDIFNNLNYLGKDCKDLRTAPEHSSPSTLEMIPPWLCIDNHHYKRAKSDRKKRLSIAKLVSDHGEKAR